VLVLVAVMVQGILVFTQMLFELHTTNLTFSNTIVAYFGALMHLCESVQYFPFSKQTRLIVHVWWFS
jgi:hypothetical protein